MTEVKAIKKIRGRAGSYSRRGAHLVLANGCEEVLI
jgi:hypothetical protein